MAKTPRRCQPIIKAQVRFTGGISGINPGPAPRMWEKLGVWGGRESKYSLGKGLGGASGPSFIEMDGHREKIYLHSKGFRKKNSARHYPTKQWYILTIGYNTSNRMYW